MNRTEIAIVTVLAVMLLLGAAIVVDAVSSKFLVPVPCKEPVGWEPPNVQLCPDDIGLWACITAAAYREDI